MSQPCSHGRPTGIVLLYKPGERQRIAEEEKKLEKCVAAFAIENTQKLPKERVIWLMWQHYLRRTGLHDKGLEYTPGEYVWKTAYARSIVFQVEWHIGGDRAAFAINRAGLNAYRSTESHEKNYEASRSHNKVDF